MANALGGNTHVGGTIASAVIGGTISEIGGGKFANGALSSAMRYSVSFNGQSQEGDREGLWSRVKGGVKKVYTKLTGFQFEGRDARNANLPTFSEALSPDLKWREMPPSEALFHDNDFRNPERKFVHPDGREAVFTSDFSSDGSYELFLEPRYKGTFNYVTPSAKPKNWYNVGGWGKWGVTRIGHGVVDVIPFLPGGNVRGPE